MVSWLLIAPGPVIASDIGPPGIENVGYWDADQSPIIDFLVAPSALSIELQISTIWKEVPLVGCMKTVDNLVLIRINYAVCNGDTRLTDNRFKSWFDYFIGTGIIYAYSNNNNNSLDYTG